MIRFGLDDSHMKLSEMAVVEGIQVLRDAQCATLGFFSDPHIQQVVPSDAYNSSFIWRHFPN